MTKRRTSRGIGSVLPAILLIILLGASSLSGGVICRFAVLGDVRPNSKAVVERTGTNPMFLRAVSAINEFAPHVTVITGDLVLGDEPLMMFGPLEWSGFEKGVTKFSMPVCLTVGNHDVWDKESLAYFEKRFGPAQYAREYQGAYFIVLNTEESLCRGLVGKDGSPTLSQDQIQWLKRQLKAAGKRPTFLFMHSPIWWPHGRTTQDQPTVRPVDDFWNKNIHPLLVQAKNVQAVFASHEHFYLYEKYDGIHYVISGGGGAELRGQGQSITGLFHHFVMVAADTDRNKTRIAVVGLDGVMSADTVNPYQRQTMVRQVAELNASPTAPASGPVDIVHKVTLENPFPEPMEINTFVVSSYRSGWSVDPSVRTMEIHPGGKSEITWHIKAEKAHKKPPQLFWHVQCGSREAQGETTIQCSAPK